MSSYPVVTVQSPPARKKRAAKRVAGVPRAVRVEPAANDDTAASTFSVFGDPLFGMAIGTGILFAVLAALIAFA
jgi:hypothetical protein